MKRVSIIGGGAWGTALAGVAARPDREVMLWAREPEVVAAINGDHVNAVYLPDVKIDSSVAASTDLGRVLARTECVLLATPAQFLRAVALEMRPVLPAGTPVVICAKGIEKNSCALMSEAAAEAMPGARIAILSGPTFAAEVAAGLPTAVTLAAEDTTLGRALIEALGTPRFRPYHTDDIVGTQIGGAVKNVLAIGCGIVAGRELGDNARAALITRGLAEMVRLGIAKGGRAETLMGLSGLGDLTLTCNGMQSRNMTLGIELGRGTSLDDVLAGRKSVAEGVASAASVDALARRVDVDMPIVAAVNAILHHGADIADVIRALLARPFRGEGLGA
ncbi:MAG: NAD(P)-dependent glycerol-3-phosphate dehydrogenase [Alphaproteobacteria bacterium]|nr:NAD(P)-dependent glycerol-3-phosphate dehydrogenase [Alphaproteobacteria bacterium]